MRRVGRFFRHKIKMWLGYAASASSLVSEVMTTTDPVSARNQREKTIDNKGRAAYCYRQAALREGMWVHMESKWRDLGRDLERMELDGDFASYGFPPVTAQALVECTREFLEEECSASEDESGKEDDKADSGMEAA
jgi:hypothetical protein